MSIRLAILGIILLCTFDVYAQGNKVLFSYDGTKVTLADFKNEFNKNHKNDIAENKELTRNFLDNYINLKLKVAEAKKQRLDKKDNYIIKSAAFKNKLIRPHLADAETVEQLAKQAYDRYLTQVKVRQILIKVSPYADPKDTLLAYNKALSIRKELINGKNFNETAIQYSDDPKAAINNGDYGYVGPFVFPLPVENYIYTKSSTNYSLPIRSYLGYHIIKTESKRKSPGYFKVAHILIETPEDTSKLVQKLAEEKINEVYDELKGGANFEELAKKYSDDFKNDQLNKELPWFYTIETPVEFESVCLSLSNGAFSKPFKTRFGWHIIKRTVHKDILPYSEVNDQFFTMVLNSKRGKRAEISAIKNLKKEYDFKDFNRIQPIIKIIDSTIFEAKWKYIDLGDMNEDLCSFNGKTYKQKDLIKYLAKNQEKCFPVPLNRYVFKKYNDFIREELFTHKFDAIAENNSEIAKSINAYNELILSNSISEKELKSNFDEENPAFKAFYSTNKDKYNNTYQVNVSIFGYSEELKKISKQLRKLKKHGASDIEIASRIKAKIDIKFELLENSVKKEGEDPLIDKILNRYKAGVLYDENYFVFEKENKLIWLNSKVSKTEVPFEEVKDNVIADYKRYSEDRWLQKLKNSYNLKINEDVFETIFEN